MNGLAEATGADRRRHPRVNVDGGAFVFVKGKTLQARIRDASRVGARVEVASEDEFLLGAGEEVVLRPAIAESQVEIICKVRHVKLTKDEHSGKSAVSMGLETVSVEADQDDLLSLLLASGTARVLISSERSTFAPEIDPKVPSVLSGAVRDAASQRILGPGKEVPVIEETDLRGMDFSDSEWAVAITLYAKPMTIVFKAYYSLDAAKGFFAAKRKKDVGDVEERLIHDYMREFCNLTVGAIKIWVADHSAGNDYGKSLLVNLPFTIPGAFESGHHPGKSLSLNHIYDCWSMKIGSGHSFICSSEIEVRNWVQVSQIATTEPEPETDDDDEIDFL